MNATRPVGSRVAVDHPKYPGVWIVKSNGPANAVLESEHGGRQLRAPHSMLTDPPVPGAVPGSTVQAIPTVEYFSNGEIVRVTNNPKYAGLYVVIADKGEKVNLAKLGGDEGYLRSPKRGIVRVALKDALREMGE